MQIEELDLRNIPSSCTSHPVIKLKSILGNLVEKSIDKVKILFKEEDIPRGIMEFMLKKHGYIVEEEGKLEDGSLFLTARRSR